MPLTDSLLERWRWDKPRKWLAIAAEIEAASTRHMCEPEQFARVLGFLFQSEDRKCIEAQVPLWHMLEHSHVWARVPAQVERERRALAHRRASEVAPPKRDGATAIPIDEGFFYDLEARAAAAARGELPRRAAGGER